MTDARLATIYRRYIDCLNRQDWPQLGSFVDEAVTYNEEPIGLSGYRDNLERDFREIPDLHFRVRLLVCQPPLFASRLDFDCKPIGRFLGLDINGRRVRFSENVFYEFGGDRIKAVWSVIDKAAIEAQLG